MSDSVQLIHAAQAIELPPGWSSATIEGLTEKAGVFVDGDWVESKDQDPTGDVRLIQLADIEDCEYRNKSDRFLTHEKALELGCTFLMRDDVLIARMPDPLGRACIFPGDRKKSVTVVDVAIVRSGKGEFNHRWLMYFINAPAFRTSVASLQSGSTRKRISRGNLARISLPVPPRGQQDRIVAEIEKQFSRLDEAVANLKRVKANLKRYKAAVLKAAVEGKLTEDWRKQHPNVEPASKLLERILADRRAKWSGRGKYKEPAKPGTNNLPSLPEKWTWATVDQLTAMVTSGSRGWGEYYSHTGPLFIRAQDIKTDSLNLQTIAHVSIPNNAEGTRTAVTKGDILITITGANVTKSALVKQLGEQAFVSQHVALLKPSLASVSTYLFTWVVSPEHGRKMLERWAYGAGKPGLSLNQIRGLPVALPPLAEQNQITAEVERRQSVIEELEVAVEANLIRADRLRQSTLTAAFSGRLLWGQDNDVQVHYRNS